MLRQMKAHYINRLMKAQLSIALKNKKHILLTGKPATGLSTFINQSCHVDLTLNFKEADTFRKITLQKNLESLLEIINSENIKTIVFDHIEQLPLGLKTFLNLISGLNNKTLIFISNNLSESESLNVDVINLFAQFKLGPLTTHELHTTPDQLPSLLKYGTLPITVANEINEVLLYDYVGTLFTSELIKGSIQKNTSNLSRFLNAAAQENGQLTNYEQLALHCEIPARTIREYYQMLIKKNWGYLLTAYQSPHIKSSKKNKFYFFDIGVAHALANHFDIDTDLTKKEIALKQLIFLELIALKSYVQPDLNIEFWEDYSNNTIDFVINAQFAFCVTLSQSPHLNHVKHIKKFAQHHPEIKCFLISMNKEVSHVNEVKNIYLHRFLHEIWNDFF